MNQQETIDEFKRALNREPAILFTGQTAAGKDTQQVIFEQTARNLGIKNIFSIVTGDLFREEESKFSPYFKELIPNIQKQGKLQSHVFATSLWSHKLLYEYVRGPIIINGSPRSIGEARNMQSFFSTMEREMIVFCFMVSDDVAKQRIELRNKEAREAGRPVRTDTDTPEKVQEKLNYFRTDVLPGIEYLDKKPGVSVYTIDTEHEPIPGIHAQVVNILGTYHNIPR